MMKKSSQVSGGGHVTDAQKDPDPSTVCLFISLLKLNWLCVLQAAAHRKNPKELKSEAS